MFIRSQREHTDSHFAPTSCFLFGYVNRMDIVFTFSFARKWRSSRWPKSMMAFRRKHLVVRRFVDKLQCKTFVFNVCHWNNTNEKAIAIAIPLAKNRFYIFLVSIQTRKTSQIEHFIPGDFSSSSVCHSSISRFRCSQNHRTHTELLRNIYTHIIFGVPFISKNILWRRKLICCAHENGYTR